MLRVIAIATLFAALAPGMARGASWRWPVRGRVVGSFSLLPDAPYAAGQRRGIAIRAAPGATVRSACAGRVAFAGSVGRAGPTLSVACGTLRATYQGLSSLAARRGAIVLPGDPVAVLDAAGVLHLGARAAQHRYVDPATLLRDQRPPLGPAPPPRPLRPARRPPPSFPVAVRDPAPRPAPAPAPSTPLVAWFGLALLALATPVGALSRSARRRRRRSARAEVAAR